MWGPGTVGVRRLWTLARGLPIDSALWTVLQPDGPDEVPPEPEPELPVPVRTDWRALVPVLGGVIHEG